MRTVFQKTLAWLLIGNGTIGALFVIILLLQGIQLRLLLMIGIFLFPILGIISGLFYFRGKNWAGWVGVAFYGIQVVRYHSQSFNFDWRSGLEMTIRPGTIREALRNVPTLEFNLAALTLLILQLIAMFQRQTVTPHEN